MLLVLKHKCLMVTTYYARFLPYFSPLFILGSENLSCRVSLCTSCTRLSPPPWWGSPFHSDLLSEVRRVLGELRGGGPSRSWAGARDGRSSTPRRSWLGSGSRRGGGPTSRRLTGAAGSRLAGARSFPP